MRLAMFSLVLSGSGLLAFGAIAAPPFEVDDPATVGRQSVELFAFYGLREFPKETIQSLPGVTLSYGVTSTTELSLAGGPIHLDDSTERWGVSDVHVQLKQRIREEAGTIPAFSASYRLTLPSGSGGLPTGDVDHALLVIAGHSVGPGSLNVNLGAGVHPEADRVASLIYGIGYIRPLSQQLRIGFEVIGQTSRMRHASDDLSWGIGMLYDVASSRSLAIRVGRTERGEPGVNFMVGLVVYFEN